MNKTRRKPPDEDQFKRVGLLGLGIMGSAIARNVIKNGRDVVGYDPNAEQQQKAIEIGVEVQGGTVDVFEKSDIVLLSLPNSEALNDSVDRITQHSKSPVADRILVDFSTLDLACKTSNLDRLTKAGIQFLDCPISGTGAQAETGDIAIYASGEEKAYKLCVPVFQDIARSVHYLGEFGNGTKMKYVANLLVAIHNVATAEALVLGESCGLDADTLCEVIRTGVGTSRIFELRCSMMANGVYDPPTMKLDVWQKDMALIADFAAANGAPTPLFSATAPLYSAAVKNGLGQKDTAAVCTVVQAMAAQQGGATEKKRK